MSTQSVRRPLDGLRVAVTRPEDEGELTVLLRAAGAIPIHLPLIRIVPAADSAPLQDSIACISDYDWVVFTSCNAVHAFVRAWRAARAAADSGVTPALPLVAAVGPRTAAAVATGLGWEVAVVPAEQQGGAVAAAMAAVSSLSGANVLWPRARDARAEIARGLAAAGARVDAPEAYATEHVQETLADIREHMSRGELDVLTFTSPSAVSAFMDAGAELGACAVAVIGPTTAAAALRAGLPVHIQPSQHTIAALVDAIARHYA